MRRTPLVVGTLLVLLLAPLAAALVGAWANGWTLASVTTGSMRPGTPPGSMVVLAPVSPADVAVGDVIGFRDARLDAVVTHRVVAVLDQPTGRFFRTRGDANPTDDGAPVPARAVVGEVRWRVAGLGGVVEALGRGPAQAALAGVPLLLLAGSEVLGARSRRRARRVAEDRRALEAELVALRAALAEAGRARPAGVSRWRRRPAGGRPPGPASPGRARRWTAGAP